ncbi:hypothetical protein HZA86_00010 [Candidatus Uhrbacteria bacterium]|nr:hypothetical protein [Candidatus Uhrbacteria bacterium]
MSIPAVNNAFMFSYLAKKSIGTNNAAILETAGRIFLRASGRLHDVIKGKRRKEI